MKKNLLLLAAAFAATTLMVGCAMFSSEKDEGADNRAKLNKLVTQARNPEKIEKTGDQKIDALADASTVLYERARKEFNNYLDQTRGPIPVGKMADFIQKNVEQAEVTEKDYLDHAKELINSDELGLTAAEKKGLTPEGLYKQGKEYYALNQYIAFIKEYDAAEDKKACEARAQESKNNWAYIKLGEKVYKDKGLDKVNWDEKLKVVEEIINDAAKITKDAGDLLNGLASNGFSLSADVKQKTDALNGIKNQALFSKDAGLWLTDEYIGMKLAHATGLNLGRLSNIGD